MLFLERLSLVAGILLFVLWYNMEPPANGVQLLIIVIAAILIGIYLTGGMRRVH